MTPTMTKEMMMRLNLNPFVKLDISSLCPEQLQAFTSTLVCLLHGRMESHKLWTVYSSTMVRNIMAKWVSGIGAKLAMSVTKTPLSRKNIRAVKGNALMIVSSVHERHVVGKVKMGWDEYFCSCVIYSVETNDNDYGKKGLALNFRKVNSKKN